MAAIIDISRTIAPGAVVFPGDEAPGRHPLYAIADGAPFNLTALTGFSTHLLTHVDVPAHFLAAGATLDAVPLERFVGRCVVVEVTGACVEAADMTRSGVGRGDTILFKTANSALPTTAPFRDDHVYISVAAARMAADIGVNMVGFDYIDIERHGDDGFPVHHALLGAGVLILEGLDLSAVCAGTYGFSALPLKIADADGAPVRAVLFP